MFSQKTKHKCEQYFQIFLVTNLLPTELPEAGLKELVKMAYK